MDSFVDMTDSGRRRRILFIATLVGILANAAPCFAQAAGPSNKPVSQLIIEPDSAGSLYAVTDSRVFKSINGGASWIELRNGTLQLGIRTIAADPADPNSLYAGTGGGIGGIALFKTTNNGLLWLPATDELRYNPGISPSHIEAYGIEALAVDPHFPNRLFVSAVAGGGLLDTLFKSTDAGKTWSRAAVQPSMSVSFEIRSLAYAPAPRLGRFEPPGVLFATSNMGVLKTDNDGNAWSIINAGLSNITSTTALIVDASTPNTLYLGTADGVFKSVNGGALWFSSSTGIPDGTTVRALAFEPTSTTTLYAGSGDRVFKSNDGGATWSGSATTLPGVNSIAVDPSVRSIVYAGTDKGVFKSVDGGSTWSPTATQLDTPPMLSAASPEAVTRGARVVVSLRGINLSAPSTVEAGDGVQVENLSVASSTSATVRLSISPTAATGRRHLTISNSEGTSNELDFFVLTRPGQLDLNGDGKADLLRYSPDTGQTSALLLDGGRITQQTVLLTNGQWKTTATGDFNGDGHSDLIWYNSTTGETVAWLLNGTNLLSWSSLLSHPYWQIVATADFNGDARSDLIWNNASTGETVIWLMDGTRILSWASLSTNAEVQIVTVANLNGDRKSDLLWYNVTTGETSAWLMDGTNAVLKRQMLVSRDWKVQFTGDFNGDGISDLLWYNAGSGETVVWLLDDDVTLVRWASLLRDGNRKVAAIADFNGDGKDDLLWYDSIAGRTSNWLMDGTNVLGENLLLTDPYWRVTETRDFNADGVSDLLWYYAPTGQTVLWLMNNGILSSYTTLF